MTGYLMYGWIQALTLDGVRHATLDDAPECVFEPDMRTAASYRLNGAPPHYWSTVKTHTASGKKRAEREWLLDLAQITLPDPYYADAPMNHYGMILVTPIDERAYDAIVAALALGIRDRRELCEIGEFAMKQVPPAPCQTRGLTTR